MAATKYPILGMLIRKALRNIATHQNTTSRIVEESFALRLDAKISTLRSWKRGSSRPTSQLAIWTIASDAVNKGGMNENWLAMFADEVGLSPINKALLLAQILGSRDTIQELTRKSPLKIFLCHSSADKAAVRSIYLSLKQDGFQPWLDERDLVGGQDWESVIRQSVRGADIVLVCLSKNAMTKEGFVQREIMIALDSAEEKPLDAIFLIPLRLEDCTVPNRLSHLHWIDFFTPNGYEKLREALILRARQTEFANSIPREPAREEHQAKEVVS